MITAALTQDEQLGRALSPTHLLWRTANCPLTPDAYPSTAPCWWCGLPSPGHARPRSVLPGTFPFPLQAAMPHSDHLCMPCGWSLCDQVALPHNMAIDRVRTKAAQGRRQQVSVRGGPLERWLTLELADGRVGLWPVGKNAAAEKPWMDSVRRLRDDPVGAVDIVSYDDLDVGPVEKWRSFHHRADPVGGWVPFTDSHRAELRAFLLTPPAPPWTVVIGDGKKHHGIQAQYLGAITRDNDACCVYHLGSVIFYRPAELSALVVAIEDLIHAGASDDEIQSGAYSDRGLPLVAAVRRHEPVIGPARGSATLHLALYLRRNRKELAADEA